MERQVLVHGHVDIDQPLVDDIAHRISMSLHAHIVERGYAEFDSEIFVRIHLLVVAAVSAIKLFSQISLLFFGQLFFIWTAVMADDGVDQLILNIRANSLSEVKRIVKLYGNQVVNQYSSRSATYPLLETCSSVKYYDITKFLIKAGANANIQAVSMNDMPLGCAITWNNTKCACALLRAGADKDVRNGDGSTPLMWALCKYTSGSKMVDLLLSAGADVTARDKFGHDVLSYAMQSSVPNEYIVILLEAGACVNSVNPRDGTTPLHFAISHARSISKVEILLEAGADVHIPDGNGRTPVMMCKEEGLVELAELLGSYSGGRATKAAISCHVQINFQ